MTTITPFNPPQNANFQFEPTLGGQTYTVIVTWSLFGQRWYINIYTLSGALVLSVALIGSPTGQPLQSLSWAGGTATATTAAPHGYEPLSTVELTVRGCTPEGYNGTVLALVTSETEFQYTVDVNPGTATVLGAASYDINLVKNYIEGSTLVFREASNQFEVTP